MCQVGWTQLPSKISREVERRGGALRSQDVFTTDARTPAIQRTRGIDASRFERRMNVTRLSGVRNVKRNPRYGSQSSPQSQSTHDIQLSKIQRVKKRVATGRLVNGCACTPTSGIYNIEGLGFYACITLAEGMENDHDQVRVIRRDRVSKGNRSDTNNTSGIERRVGCRGKWIRIECGTCMADGV